jgi:hypothetical protein
MGLAAARASDAFTVGAQGPQPGLGCRARMREREPGSDSRTTPPRPEGWQLSRKTGEEQGTAMSAGRIAVRRAISGPLTPVTSGLSRSLADTPYCRSGHVTGPDGTDSQADSASSIPVTRSTIEHAASALFPSTVP